MAEAVFWRDWLERLQTQGKPPASGQTLATMQLALRRGLESLEGPAPELAQVRNVRLPGPAGPLEARLYTPLAAGVPPGPGLVFLHGGGFVLGSLDSHDRLCRRLAAGSRVRILSVAYRLAPQHKYPAALEDALAAFDWAVGEGAAEIGFDPARVGVGGDSAGGCLAAAVAQLRRKPGPAVAFQLLLYPMLQLAETNAKRQKVLEGHLMSTAILEGVRTSYLSADDDPRDPRASPLFEPNLAGVAPAYIMIAGIDPLQHEARAYADMLAAAGVPAETAVYPSAPHGFLQLTAVLDLAHGAIAAAAGALGKGLSAR